MKIRLQVQLDGLRVDQVFTGSSETDLARQMREELKRRAPFAARLAMGALSDEALWARVVDAHNRRTGSQEPAPRTASEFLAFGERAGYVTRLPE